MNSRVSWWASTCTWISLLATPASVSSFCSVVVEDNPAAQWNRVRHAFSRMDVPLETAKRATDLVNKRGSAAVLTTKYSKRCRQGAQLFREVANLTADVLAEMNDMPNVALLDERNFLSAVGSGEFWIVDFHAPWCGHCKRLRPVFAKAAWFARPVNFGSVDCDSNPTLCASMGIKGYPTLLTFAFGKNSGAYEGPRGWVQISLLGIVRALVTGAVRTVGRGIRTPLLIVRAPR